MEYFPKVFHYQIDERGFIMRNRFERFNLSVLIFSIAMLVAGGFFLESRFGLTNRLSAAAFEAGNEDIRIAKNIDSLYDMNFNMTQPTRRYLQTYLPRYLFTAPEDASVYASLFGLESDYADAEDFYRFISEESRLDIYKYFSFIHYTAFAEQMYSAVDKTTAVNIAKSFIEERALPLSPYETVVLTNDTGHIVSFYTKLGGLVNHAFPTTVTLTPDGQILELRYYPLAFESIAQTRIKTIKEACNELPVDYPEGTVIDLKSGELVYFFENSVVQPAYLFSGEILSEGESGKPKAFSCYIKASEYK